MVLLERQGGLKRTQLTSFYQAAKGADGAAVAVQAAADQAGAGAGPPGQEATGQAARHRCRATWTGSSGTSSRPGRHSCRCQCPGAHIVCTRRLEHAIQGVHDVSCVSAWDHHWLTGGCQ